MAIDASVTDQKLIARCDYLIDVILVWTILLCVCHTNSTQNRSESFAQNRMVNAKI